MNDRVLNSGMETQYRLLLLLSLLPRDMYSSRRLSSMDFICVYGQTFGLAEKNLHGNSWMKFTEYATRGWSIDEGLKNLVLRRWAQVSAGDAGYLYSITEAGLEIATALETNYAREYRAAAEQVIERFGRCTEKELDEMIRELPMKLADLEVRDG